MKLQLKLLTIVVAIWLGICLVILFDSALILQRQYKTLEQKLALQDLSRAQSAFESLLKAINLYTTSFSVWDEVYNYLKDKNEKFVNANFVPGTFTTSKINFYILFDLEGKLVHGAAYDLDKKEFVPIPEELLTRISPLAANPTVKSNHTGFIKINNQVIAFSLLPVLTADNKGPPTGSNFMGYYLTKDNIDSISTSINRQVNLILIPPPKKDVIDTNAYSQLLNGKTEFLSTDSMKYIYATKFLNDINGEPIAILKVNIPREIYTEGIMTILHYLVLVTILGMVLAITMWFLIKKQVLDRILRISKQVIQINSEANFNKRIQLNGNDELNVMASSINSMLELIELTQDQLKYRISKRTQELEKLSLLNKNLFAEMGKQRSIESKLREDEKLLRQMAYYDTLTGLPNRIFFYEMLSKALLHADNTQTKVAIIFIDIDKFKKLNDTYGRDFGNKFLKQTALRLVKSLGTEDILARVGGDEFIAFLANANDKETIDHTIEKIFSELSVPFQIDQINITTYFSIGIAIYPDDSRTIDELLNKADLAMYYAKKREGNIFYYYGVIASMESNLIR